MSKPILFIDFDGTLCHSKFWRSLDIELSQKVQELVFKSNSTKANDWMRGNHTSEEINKFVADELAMDYGTIWELFIKDCQTMEVDIEVLKQINTLREKYTTVLVTDNMDSFSRFTIPALNLESYFDAILNSAEVGKLKGDSEGELFVQYASSLQIPFEECYLLDDSEKVCTLFRGLGGKIYQITSEKDIMYYLKSVF